MVTEASLGARAIVPALGPGICRRQRFEALTTEHDKLVLTNLERALRVQ